MPRKKLSDGETQGRARRSAAIWAICIVNLFIQGDFIFDICEYNKRKTCFKPLARKICTIFCLSSPNSDLQSQTQDLDTAEEVELWSVRRGLDGRILN